MMNKSVILAMALAFPLSVAANSVKQDATPALNALNGSLASAELTLALAQADQTIRQVEAVEAISSLTAGVAAAEISIALANVNELIQGVDDQQLLNELQDTLESGPEHDQFELIASVVAERPTLAASIQELAAGIGYDEALVAASVMSGLSDAPATAAGN